MTQHTIYVMVDLVALALKTKVEGNMPRNPKKRPASDAVELSPQARVTQQLVRQLKSYLPIHSVEQLAEKMGEVEIDGHRLPLKLFVPFVSNDLFPIETVDDLEQKLSDGVRRVVALSQSGFIPVGNPVFIEILSSTFQAPRVQFGAPGPVRNVFTYGPTPNL